jgi:predicted phosphodiesterase
MIYTDAQLKFLKTLREETDLTWDEIRHEYNTKFTEKKTTNAIRKTYKRLIELEAGTNTELESDDVLIKNIKTTYTARKTASKLRKENKVLAEESITAAEFLNELRAINAESDIKMHKAVKFKKSKKKAGRTLFAHISDTHIGCNIDKAEMGGLNEYNPTVAARRFALLFRSIAEYKLDHRSDTELVLALNGDIFAGVIHSQESVDPMSTQFASGLRIFAQGISYLAQHFKRIRVVCVTGNHDRYIHKDNKGRQSDQKWDSFGTNLYVSLRERFIDYKNIEFVIPETPYAIVEIHNHKYFITHGDTVINVGNPGKSLNIESITKQVNNFITGLGMMIDVVVVGHVHKPVFLTLDNGVDLAINGTLSGTDGFAQSIGILSNNPCQQTFEITPDYKLGDMRFIRLDVADDQKELEKIVEPLLTKF